MITLTSIKSLRTNKDEKLSPASGLALLPDGNLIVSDDFNHRLQIYNRAGECLKIIGKHGSNEGEFYYPKGLCVDSDGFIYVADCWNHRIQKFSPEFECVLSFGRYGEGADEFNEPFAIAIGSDNRLLIVDRCNHRIQVFDSDGKPHGWVGQRGTVLEEELAELYNTPAHLFSKPAFEFPNDIALDSNGNIYVVDCNNHRIVKFNSKRNLLYAFGKKGSNPGEFAFPYGIAIDENDILFISDMNNERIQFLTPQGEVVDSCNGDASHAVRCPASLFADGKGKLLVCGGIDSSLLTISYQFEETGNNKNFGENNIITLLEKGCDGENVKERLKNLMERRISISEDLIGRRLEREKEIAEKQDNFDTALVKIEKEDRELFREIRSELLTYKRLVLAKGTLLERRITVDPDNPIPIRAAGQHIAGILLYLLHFLEEQEEYDSQREKFFKDNFENMEDSRQGFKLSTHLFDTVHMAVPIIQEIAHDQLQLMTRLLEKAAVDNLLFIKEVCGAATPPLWQVIARIIIYTAVDSAPPDPFLEDAVQNFIVVCGAEGLKEILPKEPPEEEVETKILFNVFTLLVSEKADLLEKNADVPPLLLSEEEATIAIKELTNAMTNIIPEQDKLIEKTAAIEIQLSGAPLHDEPLKLSLINQHGILQFAMRMHMRSLASLFLRLRIAACVLVRNNQPGTINDLGRVLDAFRQRTMQRTFEAFPALFGLLKDKLSTITGQKISVLSNFTLSVTLSGYSPQRKSGSDLPHNRLRMLSCTVIGKRGNRDGEFMLPADIALDREGHVIIADSLNHRIQKITQNGEFILSFGGFGRLEERFNTPLGVAVDQANNIYVCDSFNHSVKKFTPDGKFVLAFGRFGTEPGCFNMPFNIAVAGNGDLSVTDHYNNRIQTFTSSGEDHYKINKEIKNLRGPSGITIASAKKLLVAEYMGNRITEMDDTGKILRRSEGQGESLFKMAGGLTLDESGNLYAADCLGNRIVIMTGELRYIGSLGGIGKRDGEFFRPTSLAATGDTLFVCDYWNSRIQRIEIDKTAKV